MSVSSMGTFARSGIEQAGLFGQMRKLFRENGKSDEMGPEKDMAAGKALTNKLKGADADAQDVKVALQYVKIGIAVVKLTGSAMAAGNSKEKGNSSKEGKGKTADGKKTDVAKVEPSAAAQQAKRNADIAGAVVAVTQQVVAALNAAADQKKNNMKRTTLDADDAAIGSAEQSLQSGGMA
jgi:hypothetical protein